MWVSSLVNCIMQSSNVRLDIFSRDSTAIADNFSRNLLDLYGANMLGSDQRREK